MFHLQSQHQLYQKAYIHVHVFLFENYMYLVYFLYINWHCRYLKNPIYNYIHLINLFTFANSIRAGLSIRQRCRALLPFMSVALTLAFPGEKNKHVPYSISLHCHTNLMKNTLVEIGNVEEVLDIRVDYKQK